MPGKGSLTDAIITAAGAVNIAARPGQAESSFGVEELLAARPDALLYRRRRRWDSPRCAATRASTGWCAGSMPARRIVYSDIAHTCGLPQSAARRCDLRRALDALPEQRAAR